MDALLLAGGYGTRLRPLTYTRPKPLLPVAGRPMLEWVLDRLPPQVDRVVVAVNWLAEELEAYFEGRTDREYIVVRESEPLGTAGAVKNCEAHLKGERFFVLNGDIVSNMDLDAMVQQHAATGAVGTIALKEVAQADVVNFGVVALDEDDSRRIRGFVEKPERPELAPSRLINAGAYLLERSVLDLIPAGQMVSMEKEIFPQLLEPGFYGWAFNELWVDVGDPDRLRAATTALNPDFVSGPECHIEGTVTDSMLGSRCHVGAGASLTRCVIGDDVRIDAGVQLVDCVVGDAQHVTQDASDARIGIEARPAGYPDKQVGNALKTS
ncbi:MAG: sugar phosphate nucleotidyltransferase [Thermoplasmatota archaeon]